MTNANLPTEPSINDSLQTSNPSGKTVLLVIGGLVLAFAGLLLFAEYFA